MSQFMYKLKGLALGICVLFVFTSFNLVWNGSLNGPVVTGDTVSQLNPIQVDPEVEEKSANETKVDKSKEGESKTLSTLSMNVLHFLIYKFKLSDILSDEKPEDKDKIISMA